MLDCLADSGIIKTTRVAASTGGCSKIKTFETANPLGPAVSVYLDFKCSRTLMIVSSSFCNMLSTLSILLSFSISFISIPPFGRTDRQTATHIYYIFCLLFFKYKKYLIGLADSGIIKTTRVAASTGGCSKKRI